MSEQSRTVAAFAHRAHARGKDRARLFRALARSRELAAECQEGWHDAALDTEACESALAQAKSDLVECQLHEQKALARCNDAERLLDDAENEVRRLKEALAKLSGDRAACDHERMADRAGLRAG